MTQKREILFNEEQPSAGNFAVSQYERTHPELGFAADVAEMRHQLRGLRGHNIKVTLFYANVGELSGEPIGHKIESSSQKMRYTNYDQIFGRNGFYANVMHTAFEEDSDGELVFYYMEITDYDS